MVLFRIGCGFVDVGVCARGLSAVGADELLFVQRAGVQHFYCFGLGLRSRFGLLLLFGYRGLVETRVYGVARDLLPLLFL